MTDVLDLAALLARWEDDQQAGRNPSAGPSDYSRCRRQVGYRLAGTDPDPGYTDDRSRATLGSLVHEGVAGLRMHYGAELVRSGDLLVEAPVDAPGLERPGTLDCYLDGTVDDLKSMGCHVWDAAVADGVMREKDRGQLGVYALALEATRGVVVDTLQVTYLNRCTGAVWIVREPLDREHAMAALLRLHSILDAHDEGRLPERDERHPRAGACLDCPFRVQCWGLDADHAAVAGPRTFAYDPDSPADELPAALALKAARLVELGELEKLHKDEKRELQQELRGWQGATFTDSAGATRRVAWTKRGTPELVDDPEAAVERLREFGEDVPQREREPKAQTLYLRVVT